MSQPNDAQEVEYLSVEDILGLFGGIQDCSDSQARLQLRDYGGIESALHRPRNYATYVGVDFALLASMLAHGIAEGQYFLDGNKRLALAAMLAFLRINGLDIRDVDEDTLSDWILQLSANLTADALADLIRPYLVERPIT